MSTVTFIRQMVDAGFSLEDALKAAEIYESNPPEKKRSSAALRQERYRRNKASRVTVCDAGDALSSPEGSSPTPPSPKPHQSIPPSPPKGGSSPTAKPTPRSELMVVLDPIHVDAVFEHRQRIGKPLTAHAAKLLAGKFARCADPNSAADAMIANGWQGFEPEWLDNRTMPRGQPPPQREPDLADLFNAKAREFRDYDDDGRTIETSYEHRDFDGPRQALPRLAASKG
ncbi:hypothetical protein FHT78_005451 [Rhizobium sp. BK196]|uniref:hypothetical protein n=1 Tax=Rhizobium sp. BK196 TaxID=2587073 RepID=UPI0016111E84|nr:hypothetical protein [Rhizobium sp. BK196]MBB3313657.1 hypothetical protein [Rhizobium sp. BK196]